MEFNMHTHRSTFFVLFIFNILLPFSAHCTDEGSGDIGYISDFLIINIRDNIEKPYTVVAAVQSDEQVKIIEKNGNYYLVETAEGKRGWISTQYVKSERPKSLIIEQLRAEKNQLEASLTGIPSHSAQNEAATNELTEKLLLAEKEIKRLGTELQHAQAVMAASKQGEIVDLDVDGIRTELEQQREAYRQLANDHVKRGERIAELENSLARQTNNTKYYWFGAGALVFFFGLLAGRSGSKKKAKLMY